METYRRTPDVAGRPDRVEIALRGADVLSHSMYNKGTAFTAEERRGLGIDGLIPGGSNSQSTQAERIVASIRAKPNDVEKYIGLHALQDRNEHLFFRVLIENLEEFLPIVYTPTVGLACRQYSHMFRRGRGIWITPDDRGRVSEVLRHARFSDVRLIVATDNEAILGIGDQGSGGMAISVGKLALYCAGAGIHPTATLPISLDVGTDNQDLLDDPLYLGWRHARMRGAEYDELVDEFVTAVQSVFPGTLIQWEDFKKNTALSVLERYRDRTLSFNDDIQGTGAVALAALITASRVTEVPLSEQRVVIFGAGAAGLGIARQLRAALREEGLDGDQLQASIAMIDSRGLITSDRELRDDYKRELAWPVATAERFGLAAGADLAAVVAGYAPTALIGSSGQAGSFTEAIVRDMAAQVERPVILPFSNPTRLSEAIPADIVAWTDGRALIATGSPFDPVPHGDRQIHIGQGNNAFIFPGLGLGALVARAKTISDAMITAAARTLASEVTADDLARGMLFPAVPSLRAVSAAVACDVIRAAISGGQCETIPSAEIADRVADAIWEPDYPTLVPV